MSEGFDPYYRWLGISPKEQPPNHYRLLGLELFEADPALIDSFALRHTGYLREITDGPHLADAQRLLNEVAEARRCLLDPQRKAAYDADLRTRLAAGAGNSDAATAAQHAVVTSGRVDASAGLDKGPPPTIIAGPKAAASGPGAKKSRPKQRRRLWAGAGAIGIVGALLVALTAAAYLFLSRPAPPRTAPVAAGVKRPAGKRPAAEAAGGRQVVQRPPTAKQPLPPSDPATTAAPAAPAAPTAAPPPDGTANSSPNDVPTPVTPPASYIPDGQPPRLPGLIMWLDAAQLPPDETRVARWSDGSPGGRSAQPKQAGRQPELLPQALSGKPVVRFRGGPWLEIPGTSQLLAGSDYTIAYVARGVGGTLLSKGSGEKTGQFSLLSDSCFLTNGELNSQTAGRLAAAGDDPARFRVRTITADATALTWHLDGTAAGSYTDDRHDVHSQSVVRIGAPWFRSDREDASRFFVGDLAELLVYDRALPEEERRGVEDYLREKWLAGGESAAPLDLMAAPTEPPSPTDGATAAMPDDAVESASDPTAADSGLAPTGEILREVWRNFQGIDAEAANEQFTNRPEPDQTETLDRLEAPADFDDHYCQRIRGFLQPPLTGDYTFTVRANEGGVLLLSTDENPENKRQVTAKDKVALAAGRAYYVEAIHWEKGGKDYFSAGWKLPDGRTETPIPGTRLSLRAQPLQPHETGFVTLTPLQAESSAGCQLRILDEGLVLADGATKENEVYRLVFQTPMPTITALQLQAVPHESLPSGGPGLGQGGSFRLGEVQVAVGAADADTPLLPARLREVLAAADDSGLARLVDGNPATLWSCRRGGQPVELTFLPAEPIRTSGAGMLHVTLHNRDNLGCFRLRATSLPDPRSQVIRAAGDQVPAAGSGLFTLFVNLGGRPWQDEAGNAWVASKDFDGATFGHEAGAAITSDASDHPLYSTAVRKLTAFRAVVPNGEYRLELHFHEHWSRNPADRSFVVTVEQQPVLRPPLFFQGPGMGQPYVHPVNRVIVKDDQLDIDFAPALPGSLTILNGVAIRQVR